MDDKTRNQPASAPPDGGGMTDATGSLTPEPEEGPFVPAELREMTDPRHASDLTAATYRRREDRRSSNSDEPGSLIEQGDRTAPNDRDGGYGSEHGLARNDPAYNEQARFPDRR